MPIRLARTLVVVIALAIVSTTATAAAAIWMTPGC